VEVDVKPGLHSTLGLQSYTSVTSPLRKYLDLVTQRQLVGLLRGDAPFYAANELKDIAALVQSVLTKAAVVEHERKFYWVLKVLKDRAGEELKALVLDVRSGGYNIILTDYLLDVHLKVPEGVFISPGDTVSVIIESVDPFAGTLRVKLKG
jgi:exoribonuclease-2